MSRYKPHQRSENFSSLHGLAYRRPRRSSPPPPNVQDVLLTPQSQLDLVEEEDSEPIFSSSTSSRSRRSQESSLRRVASPSKPIRSEYECSATETHGNGNYRFTRSRNTLGRSTNVTDGISSTSRGGNGASHRHSTGSLQERAKSEFDTIYEVKTRACTVEESAPKHGLESEDVQYSEEETFFPDPQQTFLVDKPRNLRCRICFEAPLGLLGSKEEARYAGHGDPNDRGGRKHEHEHEHEHKHEYEEKTSESACSSLASNPTAFLPCGHVLCRDCLGNWEKNCAAMGVDTCCPFCRARFVHDGCGHDVKARLLARDSVKQLPPTLGEGGKLGHKCLACRTDEWHWEFNPVNEALKASVRRSQEMYEYCATYELREQLEGAKGMLHRHSQFVAKNLRRLLEENW